MQIWQDIKVDWNDNIVLIKHKLIHKNSIMFSTLLNNLSAFKLTDCKLLWPYEYLETGNCCIRSTTRLLWYCSPISALKILSHNQFSNLLITSKDRIKLEWYDPDFKYLLKAKLNVWVFWLEPDYSDLE